MPHVVHVELVGGNSWDWIVPTAALLLSLFSIGLTLWFRRRDDARVVLTLHRSLVGYEFEGDYVVIEATNKGRSGSTVVQHVSLSAVGAKENLVSTRYLAIEQALPWKLGPGESQRRYLDRSFVHEQFGVKAWPLDKAIAEATTGHGSVTSKAVRLP